MKLNIQPVDVAYVHQTWPLVSCYIKESFDKGLDGGTPDYSTDNVLGYLASGQWQLIVATDNLGEIHGAMTVSYINYPLHRIAFVTATGGKLIINKETFDQLTRIAKYNGATKIKAMARPAMVRLLKSCNMVPCNTMMEYQL